MHKDNSLQKKDQAVFSFKYFLVISLIIILHLFQGPFADGAYIFLIFYAITSSRNTIKSLTLLVILNYLNPSIFTGSQYGEILRWLIIFSASIRVYFNFLKSRLTKKTVPAWLLALIVFCLVIVILSFFNSYGLSFSVFKLIIFFVTFSTVLLAFQQTPDINWGAWFGSVFTAVLILSIPLFFMPEGYHVHRDLFQGILSHPQAYGVFIIIPTAWLLGKCMIYKTHFLTKVIAILGLVAAIETRSRTAILAFVLAFLVGLLILIIRNRNKGYRPFNKKVVKVFYLPLIVVLLGITLFNYNSVLENSHDFLIKHQTESIAEGIKKSRSSLIEPSLHNFRENPLAGIGFSIPSSKRIDPQTYEIVGIKIPTGGSPEKGLIVTALLEETGVIGFFSFLVFLIILSLPIVKYGSIMSMLLFFTAIFVNFGETVFFAPGGLGLYVYLLIGLAITSSYKERLGNFN